MNHQRKTIEARRADSAATIARQREQARQATQAQRSHDEARAQEWDGIVQEASFMYPSPENVANLLKRLIGWMDGGQPK